MIRGCTRGVSFMVMLRRAARLPHHLPPRKLSGTEQYSMISAVRLSQMLRRSLGLGCHSSKVLQTASALTCPSHCSRAA